MVQKSTTLAAPNTAVTLLFLAGLLTLQGCSQKIDARQAHVEQGLIYKKDASDPFTGTLTNVDPSQVARENGSRLLPGEANCIVPVKDGLFDGTVVCEGASGNKLAEVTYTQGHQDGALKTWSATSGVLTASLTVHNRVLDGLMERFNPETGKLIHRVNLVAGKKVGEEKQWDLTGETLLTDLTWADGLRTGVYRNGPGEERYKNGQRDGLQRQCLFLAGRGNNDARQAYMAKSFDQGATSFIPQMAENPSDYQCTEVVYKDGMEQRSPIEDSSLTTTGAGSDACLDAKIAAFRKENGDEAPIVHDVLNEWEASCK